MSTKSVSPKKTDRPLKTESEVSVNADTNEDQDHALLSDPEDYLEDNESLDMNLANGDQKIWLVRLPRYLADKWSNTEEMSGKQLGRVKIRNVPSSSSAGASASGSGNGKKLQVKLLLNNENGEYNQIPQEYDISILNTQVKNSYVFSEENLKKFKQELTEVAQLPEQPQLQPTESNKKGLKNKPQAGGKKPYRFFRVQKNRLGADGQPVKKYVPFVKTIPKKTALIGKICHDCQIVPSKSDSKYSQMLLRRQEIQTKPRPKVTLLDETPGVIQSQTGPSIKGNNTSAFLRSTLTKDKKGGEGRAIRMPKKDLLDLLFRLFEEYEYWSMKGLKERTRQPESYLKESLDSIANLIKKGPYTSKYNLKPEYRRLRDAERAARLGLEDNTGEDEKEDEDEDDIEMEDVI
ncbi:uncharacterized protein KQ657_004731 [Scheffersomyces spartinae]|uniref:Transcription initiation factor IIF subunit beta n=1 Tax=Scheffersomyces spartinae TaxID=45513 RepID=A0A9P7VAL4_9ASCO|nr:uncharacterized protein KQ657_004731 [Scheffersomyces spartinae]KAG7194516.1 hypothetical protein KQ657_004731 [Scheffersomyces spartinae]